MIVIIFPQLYGVHGIARYVQSFLAATEHTNQRIVVLTGDAGARPLDAPKNVEFIHLPLNEGRFGLLRWSLAARKWLLKTVHHEKISLINLHIPPLLPGLFLPRVAKIVVTAHTTYLGMSGQFYTPRQFESPWNPLSVWVKKLFEHFIFYRSDFILTLTEQGRQEVLRYGFKHPIEILPNGASINAFTPDRSVQKDCDVLFAGRIEKRKGSRPMVDACKALIALKPDIRICIVGYGDDYDYVTQELSPLASNVELTGKIEFDAILARYRRSRIYASTSYYEGLPGTCLEAMAVGLPAIVWDYLFYRELVSNGETGRLIPVNDTVGFAKATIELLSDQQKIDEMSVAARSRIVNHYDWKVIASKLLLLYTRLGR